MITETQIDLIVEDFEKNQSKFETVLEEIDRDNAQLFDILLGSHAEVLNDEEMDYLIFLFVIIYKAISQNYSILKLEEEAIEIADEASWEIINDCVDFTKSYDRIESEHSEKELLEFIFISLEEDEDNNISETGRLVMLSVLASEVKLLCVE
ncbi:MAG: hypothetical protein ABI851_11000 [Saprospiraceae bacterium]